MAYINDETKITKDHTLKNINNFSVKVNEDGSFELWLFHEEKVSFGHVDEAEIVGSWKFSSISHLETIKELIETSVKNNKH